MQCASISDNFLISRVKRSGESYTMPEQHYHNGYEIYYLVKGERNYFIKDRTSFVKKGDVVLINKNVLHKTLDTGKPAHERVLIEFNEEFIKDMLSKIDDIKIYTCFKNYKRNVYSLDIEEQTWLENTLFNMLQEKKYKRKGYLTYIKIKLIEILIFLNRKVKESSPSSPDFSDPLQQKISEIATYINNNHQDGITLKLLARKFGLSPSYLSKSFKKVTGFNFVEYKNNVRVKEARRLLQETDLNVTKIAGIVGYNNITHLGRIFKDITGYSPLKYRKLHREE